jgi:glycopeptide antibiotics resistance protein
MLVDLLGRVLSLPLGGDRGHSLRAAGELEGLRWVNLVPIRELLHNLPTLGAGRVVREFGGNILLLAPFTLFVPLVWSRLRIWWWPPRFRRGGTVRNPGPPTR